MSGALEISVWEKARRQFRATATPGTRLACIVESLAGHTYTVGELIARDPHSFDHIALCLHAHGVALNGRSTRLVFEAQTSEPAASK